MSEEQVADRSVALVVTSPPYFAGKEYETEVSDGHVPASYVEYLATLEDVFAVCLRKLEPGGRMAVNVANLGRKPYRSLSADVMAILQDRSACCCGAKSSGRRPGAPGATVPGAPTAHPQNPVLRDVTERVVDRFQGPIRPGPQEGEAARQPGLPHRSTIDTDEFLEATLDVWEIPSERRRGSGHPAPFPVALPRRLIELYTYADDLVLDPFIGSGSTAVAAVGDRPPVRRLRHRRRATWRSPRARVETPYGAATVENPHGLPGKHLSVSRGGRRHSRRQHKRPASKSRSTPRAPAHGTSGSRRIPSPLRPEPGQASHRWHGRGG